MPNQPPRRTGIARVPLRLVILVIAAVAALAAAGCGRDGGTGPVELLGARRVSARALGTWAREPAGSMAFPGLGPGIVVLADTLRLDADGALEWRLVTSDPAGQVRAGTLGMRWEVRHDSLFFFTSCSRDPRCFTAVVNWTATFDGPGQLALRPEFSVSSSSLPRRYLRPGSPP